MWCLLVQTEIMRRAFIFIPSRPIYKHTSSNEVCLRRLRSPNKESSNGAASCMLSYLRSITMIQVSIRDSDSPLYAEWRAAASGKSNSADAKLSCGLRAPRAKCHVTTEVFQLLLGSHLLLVCPGFIDEAPSLVFRASQAHFCRFPGNGHDPESIYK